MPILEGEKVVRFFGGLAAVSYVDFQVEEGGIFGLIGPNGAGKTTLFNLISAALAPQGGVIRFEGREITGFKPHRICRLGLARTFQTVKIFGNMSVLENVLLGAFFGSPGHTSSRQGREEALEVLDFVGLSGAAGTPAKELTLSSQKRLEVARALAIKPKLILLDEIMAGLNQTEVEQAMELVRRIRETGVTVVMIEHVMRAIMNLCDRIMVLHHGRKLAEGTPGEIAASKQVIEVYLGE